MLWIFLNWINFKTYMRWIRIVVYAHRHFVYLCVGSELIVIFSQDLDNSQDPGFRTEKLSPGYLYLLILKISTDKHKRVFRKIRFF